MSIILFKGTFVKSDITSNKTNLQLSGMDSNLIIYVNSLLLETLKSDWLSGDKTFAK